MKIVYSHIVKPKPPYNFDLSVRNPSHYPVPTNTWTPGRLWFTMRWKRRAYGVRFVNQGTVTKPGVKVTIFSERKIDDNIAEAIQDELAYRFEWNADLSSFYQAGTRDKLLRPVLKRLKGMRDFCAENLYELLMISILLQNAPIKRTESMTRALLEKYGDKLSFDNQDLYCFWSPEQIINSTEAELRALKVGYRAKSFMRATRDLSKFNEEEMRSMDDVTLRKELQRVYGVGPATADTLMLEAFHRRTAFDAIPPWECKIFSKVLFNKPLVNPERVRRELVRRYGFWRGLAAHYLFMDLCWRHKKKPIEWFGRLMPY